MELIECYFPGLTDLQRERFSLLGTLYGEWNARINVISRRDMEHFYERHVLHSLALARVARFSAGMRVMDVGTGGGFPGVPLAILFPEVEFTLVDSIGKKIRVVSGVAGALGLENIVAVNGRAEGVTGRFDHVVTRAVADMPTLLGWTWPKIAQGGSLLALKGGDLGAELAAAGRKYTLHNIGDLFAESFFATKQVVKIVK